MEMIYHYAQNYRSENKKRPFATPIFYAKLFKIVYDASRVALKGEYSDERWVYDSFLVGQAMESVGADIVIEGHENIKKLDRPCVFVANHTRRHGRSRLHTRQSGNREHDSWPVGFRSDNPGYSRRLSLP